MGKYITEIQIEADTQNEANKRAQKLVRSYNELKEREEAFTTILNQIGITDKYIYRELKKIIKKTKSDYIKLIGLMLISQLKGQDFSEEEKNLYKKLISYLNTQSYDQKKTAKRTHNQTREGGENPSN